VALQTWSSLRRLTRSVQPGDSRQPGKATCPLTRKKAIVGYYLGNLEKMAIPTNSFSLVDAQSGVTKYQGTLTLRTDVGYKLHADAVSKCL